LIVKLLVDLPEQYKSDRTDATLSLIGSDEAVAALGERLRACTMQPEFLVYKLMKTRNPAIVPILKEYRKRPELNADALDAIDIAIWYAKKFELPATTLVDILKQDNNLGDKLAAAFALSGKLTEDLFADVQELLGGSEDEEVKYSLTVACERLWKNRAINDPDKSSRESVPAEQNARIIDLIKTLTW
jgi:hypothetical protein